ncbi:MAG: 50S ribosomal protein L4 [Elusimicrobiaceae bacterium]
METAVLNTKGEKVGKCEMPEKVFGVTPDKHFLYEAITSYLANQRVGTACAKTRAEVSGGGKKPWKQKGTGRARQGSIRSPLWTGGGVVFGPRPHSFRKEMSQTKRHRALAQALSGKMADGVITVVDKLALSEAKTAQLAAILKTLSAGKKPMLVTGGEDQNVIIAGRNISGLRHLRPENLNAYEVLNSSRIVITTDALSKVSTMWDGKGE